jgi:hypothetical protein
VEQTLRISWYVGVSYAANLTKQALECLSITETLINGHHPVVQTLSLAFVCYCIRWRTQIQRLGIAMKDPQTKRIITLSILPFPLLRDGISLA